MLAVYRPLLEPIGLTHPQYLVMLALWGEAPMSVKDIGEAIQLDSPTLSPLLERLEAAGLLTRRRDRHDERNLVIDLTAEGRALRKQAEQIPPAVVERLGYSCGMRLPDSLQDWVRNDLTGKWAGPRHLVRGLVAGRRAAERAAYEARYSAYR